MNKLIKSVVLASSIGALSGVSYAATQGTLGATSTGDFLITAVLQDLVRVSSLDDLNLGTYSGTGPLAGSEAFCVYRNGSGAYDATVTGDGGDGLGSTFDLYDGSANYMAYTVTYNGNAILSGGTTGTEAGNSSLQDCGGANVANNATIAVSIAAPVLQASPTGTYTGTVTVLIAPQ